MASKPAISVGEAERIVNDRVAYGLRQYDVQHPPWEQVARLSEEAGSNHIDANHPVLEKCSIIYDVRKLQLNAGSIERCLRARCDILKQHQPKFHDFVEFNSLRGACLELERVAAICPEPIRLALAGNVRRAIAVIPRGGTADYSLDHIIGLVEFVASCNLLASLIEAALSANLKMSEPFGHSLLDNNRALGPMLYKRAGKNLIEESARQSPLAAIYQTTKTRPASVQEQALLQAEPRVVHGARAMLQQLEVRYGPLTIESVDNLLNAARSVRDRNIAEVTRRISKSPANQTVYTIQGTQPLERLWFRCVKAIEWMKIGHDGTKLLDALRDVRDRKPLQHVRPEEEVRSSAYTSESVRKMFFLLRHLYVRDKYAVLPGETDRDIISTAIEARWQREIAKHSSQEPFDTTVMKKANLAWTAAVANGDAAFFAEINGPLSIQLRLE